VLNPFSIRDVLSAKESHVRALNYSCDFKRLTQLFGRALQIKYYTTKEGD